MLKVFFKKTLVIFIGSLLLSIGINLFLAPHHLLDGGIIGVGLILHYLSGMATGFLIIMISIPIYLIALRYFRTHFFNGIHGMMISAFLIDLLSPLDIVGRNLFPINISSILGGLFIGIGIGLMLKYGISTGGLDLIAQFISQLFNINVGMIIFVFDLIIVTVGGALIGTDRMYYTFITIAMVFLSTSLLTRNKSY